MTPEEFDKLEQDLVNSGLDNKSYLTSNGIKLHKYYYWKRKSRELKESSMSNGQFLPIDVHSGGLIKSEKRCKGNKQPFITHGEIEIELRTPSGAELRIRGIMDSLMVSTIIACSSSIRRNV